MKLKNTFSTKLFITNLLVLVICTASILFYFYHFLTNKEISYVKQTLQTLHTKTTDQVDTLVNSLDKTAVQIAATPYIYTQFNQLPNYNYLNFFERNSFLRAEMRDYLIPFILKDQSVTRICLYNQKSDFIDIGYKSTDAGAINSFFLSEAFEQIGDYFATNSKQSLFIPPQQDPYSYTSIYNDPIQLLSVIRPIKNYMSTDGKIIGFVEVQIDYSVLENIFSSLDDDLIAFIIDPAGNVIYPLAEEPTQFFYDMIDTNQYLHTQSSFATIDYELVFLKNTEALVGEYRHLQNTKIGRAHV